MLEEGIGYLAQQCGEDEIIGGGKGHCHFDGEPRYCVRNVCGARFAHPGGVALVGVKSRAGVLPSVIGVWGPSVPVAGLVMNKNYADATRGCNAGRSVKIKLAIELGPRRQLGIDTGTAKEVECQESLGHTTIP
jgi:hypothetical protein